MQRALLILMLWAGNALAEQPVLRFSVAESWSMPLIRIEQDQPVEGILFDLMQTLAQETGIRAEYHVMARLRVQQAMDAGEVDVRCHVTPTWLDDRFDKFLWSVPLLHQRDLLVGSPGQYPPARLEQLPAQAVGTVLGYHYPALDTLFADGRLRREDSRNQVLALQKLQAGRYRHAVSNEFSLLWFNRTLPPEQRLKALAVLEEQDLSCIVRNDPAVPTQAVLSALAHMKQSGQIERILQRYNTPSTQPVSSQTVTSSQISDR
ncbi:MULTISPECIES: substrate-binding periplasmic protein [Pseudomonas]|uniref:Bacterial extracellular solute-binding protein,family 3 n=1 Tax=Pseudomonas putida TaxID=303 RepID=A0A1B2F8K5_PSEPU|nr:MULTISPECIES: transporter substrate-binding domain-containing protein [Pseudomonas]ANY88567.1 Bacterial extracellular solute-binding protein,family 3 [Pseudomonas putida]MCL8305851.1 transporter substrate-binding domain-containing protein [Pseudomonas putida]